MKTTTFQRDTFIATNDRIVYDLNMLWGPYAFLQLHSQNNKQTVNNSNNIMRTFQTTRRFQFTKNNFLINTDGVWECLCVWELKFICVCAFLFVAHVFMTFERYELGDARRFKESDFKGPFKCMRNVYYYL